MQPAGGQATEELCGAVERGVGIAAADERRDRRRLLRLGAAPAQAPEAAVDAAGALFAHRMPSLQSCTICMCVLRPRYMY